MQPTSGATVSSSPQLVPVSPVNPQLPQVPISQFQTQTLHIGPRFAQAQHQNGSTTLITSSALSLPQMADGHVTQVLTPQLGDDPTSATLQQIQTSIPTQVIPISQPKDLGQPQLVPLSLPQLMPVTSIAGTPTGTLSFPQVVPATPSLSIPSPGGAFQILTSGTGTGLSVAQGPIRLSPIGPPQSVPTGTIPGVQLLNSGVIQLPSAPPGMSHMLISQAVENRCFFSFVL